MAAVCQFSVPLVTVVRKLLAGVLPITQRRVRRQHPSHNFQNVSRMAELNHILFLYQILSLFYLSSAVLGPSDPTVVIVCINTHLQCLLQTSCSTKNCGSVFGWFFTISYSTYSYLRSCRGTSPARLPTVRSDAFPNLAVERGFIFSGNIKMRRVPSGLNEFN